MPIIPAFKRLAIYSKWSKTGFHSEPFVDTGTSGIMPGSHFCIICGFSFFSFLTKIQYTFSVLTSVSYNLQRVMYNSVAECLPSIHKGLGLIPNTTRMKSKTIEFLWIFHLTIQWLWMHRVCPCCWNHTGGEAMDSGLREIWVWNALVGFFPLVCLSQKLKVQ